MKRAFEVGATQADIFDVLHLVAVQGVASVCQATDILAEFIDLTEVAAIDEKLQARIDRLGSAHALALSSWRGSTPAMPKCFSTLSSKVAPARA